MPGSRPTPRSQAPGREKNPRPGTQRERRAATPGPVPAVDPPAQPKVPAVKAEPPKAQARGGFSVTRRALTLIAVLAILGLSYARSLTVYLSQEREIHAIELANEQRQAAIAALEDEVERWADPDYVRAQARERLGWVLPGEIGYRVIAGDGELFGVPEELVVADVAADQGPWYQQVWSSVKAADLPPEVTIEEALPTNQPPTEVIVVNDDVPE
jgi:cell division protein FtsB